MHHVFGSHTLLPPQNLSELQTLPHEPQLLAVSSGVHAFEQHP
jgi:hypothetical protein